MQKSLEASEEDNHSLSAMNDCLHKNSEKLKSKLEWYVSTIREFNVSKSGFKLQSLSNKCDKNEVEK